MVEIESGPVDPATGESKLERKFRGQPRKRTLEDMNRTGIGLVALAMITVLLAGLVILTKVGPGYKRVSADFIQAAALLPKNRSRSRGSRSARSPACGSTATG